MREERFLPAKIPYDVTLWGPFLWQSELLSEIINELLARAFKVRNVLANHAEGKLAALMHDEWSYSSEDMTWFAEVINPWVCAYLDTFQKTTGHSQKELSSLKKWNLDSLWVNFQKQYDFNPPHNHSGSLSFVIYLNIPDELQAEGAEWHGTGPKPGTIIFQYGEELPLIPNKRVFMPKKGDIFIFPASLVHMVVPFRTPDVERISVSGNITLDL